MIVSMIAGFNTPDRCGLGDYGDLNSISPGFIFGRLP